jgi:hypothetical protein
VRPTRSRHRPCPARSLVASLLVLAASSSASAGCASSTTIQSEPAGARLFIDGVPVGKTPFTMTDVKVVGSTTDVRLEHPGYEPLTSWITRDEVFLVEACVAGVFLLVPFLWMKGYHPTRIFRLRPVGGSPAGAPATTVTPAAR